MNRVKAGVGATNKLYTYSLSGRVWSISGMENDDPLHKAAKTSVIVFARTTIGSTGYLGARWIRQGLILRHSPPGMHGRQKRDKNATVDIADAC